MDSTWSIVDFAPELFVEIKPMNKCLVETERRVGEYMATRFTRYGTVQRRQGYHEGDYETYKLGGAAAEAS